MIAWESHATGIIIRRNTCSARERTYAQLRINLEGRFIFSTFSPGTILRGGLRDRLDNIGSPSSRFEKPERSSQKDGGQSGAVVLCSSKPKATPAPSSRGSERFHSERPLIARLILPLDQQIFRFEIAALCTRFSSVFSEIQVAGRSCIAVARQAIRPCLIQSVHPLMRAEFS